MATRRPKGICAAHHGEYTLGTLDRYGGICGRCYRAGGGELVKCTGPCGKTFAPPALRNGRCQRCHAKHVLNERIQQLEQENAELKKTLNNTIAAYASLVSMRKQMGCHA